MPASIKHLLDKKLNLTSLLARWKDGLYYTAAIVKCDKNNKKCLVCFEDGSEVWVNNRDVHIQLTTDQLNEDEDIVCCICDDGNSEQPNEIILCDVCQQGYHQKCHNPPVDSSKIDESEETSDHKDWFCATCSYILNQSNRAKLSATAQQPKSQAQAKSKQQPKTQPQTPQKQPPSRVKQTATPQKQPPPPSQQTTVGPIKTQHVQKSAPYYPLSSQMRVATTSSSTAALASMTASSALVVGSSAGRTKQDLVNQSNRGSYRQKPGVGNNVVVEVASPPVKHAVRKSSVNFVMPPVKQSALPTATRSILPNIPPPQPASPRAPPQLSASQQPPAKVPHLIATTMASNQTSHQHKSVVSTSTHIPSVTTPTTIQPISVISTPVSTIISIAGNNNTSKITPTSTNLMNNSNNRSIAPHHVSSGASGGGSPNTNEHGSRMLTQSNNDTTSNIVTIVSKSGSLDGVNLNQFSSSSNNA